MASTKNITKEAQAGMSENLREIWLAGLGLFATVEEEGEKLFNKFIEKGRGLEEKGETFEKKAKDQLNALAALVSERAGKLGSEVSEKVNEMMPSFIEERFQSALETFGLSRKSEVNKLNEKVNKLSEMVGTLSDKMSKPGKPAAPTTKA